MSQVRYRVEVVGGRALDRITDPDRWLEFLGKTWEALGKSSTGHILNRIGQAGFRKPTGNLQRAVAWEAGQYSMIVYMDERVAPYAFYQEQGVRQHVMRYLLNARGPIPLPHPRWGSRRPIFRRATERWMGVPHFYFDFEDHDIKLATGWIHPGYEGKWYFREGMQDAVAEAAEHIKVLSFRVISEG